MAGELNFSIEIDPTRDLAINTSRVDALITVTARPIGLGTPAARLAEVLIMDRSLSMMSENKMPEAQRAACTALDALPDGTFFGIIAGSRKAEFLFPSGGGLTLIDAKTRAAAKRQVMRLRPAGGTEIGRWLVAANQLFAAKPAAGTIRHAVLYTDGKNEHETPTALGAALNACADRFLCDVRGLGNDWDYRELLRIAETLHGEAAAVLEIADLADDFTRLIRRAQRLVVPRAYLRLRPNHRFAIGSVAQTHPVRVELTQRQQPAGGAAVDIPLGSWEAETRCYQLTLSFTPDTLPMEEELRAALVELLVESTEGERTRCADAALAVLRHATPDYQTIVPDSHTRAELERELAVTMQSCVDAWVDGRADEADYELDHAIGLARAVADRIRRRRLESVAIIGSDGRTRVRPDVTPGEMQQLGLESTKTSTSVTGVRSEDVVHPVEAEVDRLPAEARICRACGERTSAWRLKHCEACGQLLDDAARP